MGWQCLVRFPRTNRLLDIYLPGLNVLTELFSFFFFFFRLVVNRTILAAKLCINRNTRNNSVVSYSIVKR